MEKIDCNRCKQQHVCCETGALVDLEEAKKILDLNLDIGGFFRFEKDEDFPSGYSAATSHDDGPCSFLTEDGLCAIHKVSYDLKPTYCKQFPYEDGKIAHFAKDLCLEYKKTRRDRAVKLWEKRTQKQLLASKSRIANFDLK